jgi:hypothetical protein
VFDGVIALVTVVLMRSHACCDWIVTRKVWRLVPGTTSKTQLVGPVVVASPSRSIVSVPFHVPATNDGGDDGVVGAGAPPSQATVVTTMVISDQTHHRRFMRPLLRERAYDPAAGTPTRTDPYLRHSREWR